MTGNPFGTAAEAWTWYQDVEAEWTKAKSTGGYQTEQTERWHLANLHSQSALGQLANQLSNATNQRVVARSFWIDARPQCHFRVSDDGYEPPTHAKESNVELADLLFITAGKVNNTPVTALLVQGKVVSQFAELDADTCDPGSNSSSNKERNLLELCWPNGLTLKHGAQVLGTFNLLDRARAERIAAGDEIQPGLAFHGSYLAMAKPGLPHGINAPYEVLWPSERTSGRGVVSNLGDVLLHMLEGTACPASENGRQVQKRWGRRLNAGPLHQAGCRQWTALVTSLYEQYASEALERFSRATGKNLDHLVKAISQFQSSATPPGIAMFREWSEVLRSDSHFADSDYQLKKPEPPRPNALGEGRRMVIIEITAADSDNPFSLYSKLSAQRHNRLMFGATTRPEISL